ncbi:MAG: hypothetical protein IJ298_01135 [Ruminococcus sp.]|nr:hypothetical protein [Ruminococcus sp.]
MKKILAFILAILVALSLSVLWGCSDDKDNTDTTGMSGATVDESPLAGEWKVTSTDDEILWMMNSQSTLHITAVRDGSKYTVVCRYSYDEQTGEFEYTCLSASGSFKGTLALSETSMIVRSTDNSEVIVLTRIT